MGSTDKIVSSENEELILVDEQDNEVGYLSKQLCHDGEGILHRAFSLFIFNPEGELLLQKRSASKRLWPLFWSNSCCSHPRKGESMELATRRRLKEELSIEVNLEFVYKFSYQARFEKQGSERELCSVFLGKTDQAYSKNVNEIADVRFLTRKELQNQLQEKPEEFTPWFKMEWDRLCGEYANKLAGFAK